MRSSSSGSSIYKCLAIEGTLRQVVLTEPAQLIAHAGRTKRLPAT